MALGSRNQRSGISISPIVLRTYNPPTIQGQIRIPPQKGSTGSIKIGKFPGGAGTSLGASVARNFAKTG